MSPCFRVKTGGREVLPDDQVQYGFSAVGLFTEWEFSKSTVGPILSGRRPVKAKTASGKTIHGTAFHFRSCCVQCSPFSSIKSPVNFGTLNLFVNNSHLQSNE